MKPNRIVAVLIGALALAALSLAGPGRAAAENEGLFADLHTSKGVVTARLHYRRAPLTVMNFIQLAEGTREWQHPTTGATTSEPLYRNIAFHLVRDFMIQTGDPAGTGKGGPGYVFDDEFHPELSHAEPGILSMGNRGPNTNGSQFFITKLPAPWLDGRYTAFGTVVAGIDVVGAIVVGDRLDKIVIRREGSEAARFDVEYAHVLANRRTAELRKAAEKNVPEPSAPVDPAKLPAADQPHVSPGNFEFIVIGHSEMPDVKRIGRDFYYDRAGAIDIAGKLVRLARSEGANFSALREKYSDMRRETVARNVADSPMAPAGLKAIFALKPGQISDPIDLPTGVYIFLRLPE